MEYEVTWACELLELRLEEGAGSLIYSRNHLLDRHHRDPNPSFHLEGRSCTA